MTIYEEFIRRVEEGENFRINLHTKTLKVGKDKLIDAGIYEGELMLTYDMNVIKTIEDLYAAYRTSTPTERSERRRQSFKALSVEELTDVELVCGENRDIAQAKLEGFVLCAVLSGVLQWHDSYGSWFWRSDNHPDLVILKQWIER